MPKRIRKKEESADPVCALCEREVGFTTLHHLIPREEGGRHGPTAPLCQPCHSTVHLTFTNKELAVLYNSIPALRESEGLQKYLQWVRTKRLDKITNRRGKRK
ncbi:HNH endonuclease [Rufibacter sediminis]|uniref:HNH endonuclease n=1 Tax=Rufibacter sediminis TaxID=2762756 RepID=A0ABR6VWA9_9BACT|nr:HNH endonuclease signature motif containing protein [Rufibacter sediminis]MBC3541118.1 HNH endonuclease [Rufibacter sediminis]